MVALDTKTGCVKWATPGGVRASLAYGQLGKGGPWAVVGGDGQGNLIAFDAKTGKVVWSVDPRHDKTVPLSGTPDLRRRQDRRADLGHRRGATRCAPASSAARPTGPWRC